MQDCLGRGESESLHWWALRLPWVENWRLKPLLRIGIVGTRTGEIDRWIRPSQSRKRRPKSTWCRQVNKYDADRSVCHLARGCASWIQRYKKHKKTRRKKEENEGNKRITYESQDTDGEAFRQETWGSTQTQLHSGKEYPCKGKIENRNPEKSYHLNIMHAEPSVPSHNVQSNSTQTQFAEQY